MSVRNLTALSASNQKGHACCKFDPPKSLTVLERKQKIFPVHSFLMAVFSCQNFTPPAGPGAWPDLDTAAGSSLASLPSGPGTQHPHTKARCTRACAAAGPGSSWRSTCSSWTTRSSFHPLPGPGEEGNRKPV